MDLPLAKHFEFGDSAAHHLAKTSSALVLWGLPKAGAMAAGARRLFREVEGELSGCLQSDQSGLRPGIAATTWRRQG